MWCGANNVAAITGWLDKSKRLWKTEGTKNVTGGGCRNVSIRNRGKGFWKTDFGATDAGFDKRTLDGILLSRCSIPLFPFIKDKRAGHEK